MAKKIVSRTKKSSTAHKSHQSKDQIRILHYTIVFAIVVIVASAFMYISVLHQQVNQQLAEAQNVQGISDNRFFRNMMFKSSTAPHPSTSVTPPFLRCRPEIVSPQNGEVVKTDSLVLTWKGTCPEIGTYQVRLTGAGIRPVIAESVKGTSYTVADTSVLKEGRKYMWAVGGCMPRPTHKPEPSITRMVFLTREPQEIADRGSNFGKNCRDMKWSKGGMFFWKSIPPSPSRVPSPTASI